MFFFCLFYLGEKGYYYVILNVIVCQIKLIIMKQKLKNNPNFNYFIAYSLSFVAYGCTITAIGPLIPYLSAISKRQQTQYSVFFFWRSIGFLLVGLIVKFFQKHMTLHNSILLFSFLCGISLILFSFASYSSIYIMSILIFISSLFYAALEIIINVSMILTHKNHEPEFWLQLNHGIFGIGGLIGPILVYLFQTYTYAIIGLTFILLSPYYYYLKTPESLNLENEKKNIEDQNSTLKISNKAQNLLYLIFFLYVGMQCIFGGWVSSYAVIQKVATKQQATKYGSIFWLMMTIFRFYFAFVAGKISRKMIFLSSFNAINAVISVIILLFDYKLFVIWFCTILNGMLFAPLFPLQYALPSQNSCHLSVSQSANAITAAAIGQAVLSFFVGYLMNLTNPNMLFYSLAVLAVLHYILSRILISQLDSINKQTSLMKFITNNQLQQQKSHIQLQPFQINEDRK